VGLSAESITSVRSTAGQQRRQPAQRAAGRRGGGGLWRRRPGHLKGQLRLHRRRLSLLARTVPLRRGRQCRGRPHWLGWGWGADAIDRSVPHPMDERNCSPLVVRLPSDRSQHVTSQIFQTVGGGIALLKPWTIGDIVFRRTADSGSSLRRSGRPSMPRSSGRDSRPGAAGAFRLQRPIARGQRDGQAVGENESTVWLDRPSGPGL